MHLLTTSSTSLDEIVVIVLGFRIVPGWAIGNIVFGCDPEPKQQSLINLAVARGEYFDVARQRARNRRARAVKSGIVQQIALVQHNQVGARDLIFEYFLDRVVVHERTVGGALSFKRLQIGGDAAVGERGAIDNDDHAVDSDAVFDRGPMKGLHQRFGQSQARRLDDNVIDAVFGQNRVKRGHELVSDRAAQAAIGKFDDVVFGAGGVAATFENLAVDADIAEFIDNDCKPTALGIGQNVTDQGRFAGAKKARNDSAGDAREPCGESVIHGSLSTKSNGGTRAIKARLRISGRPRHGRMPSLAPARSFAPATRASALVASSPPNT